MILLLNWDGSKYLSEILGKIMLFLPNLASALFILILGIFISKLLSKFISKALSKTKIDKYGEGIRKIELIDKLNINFKISNFIGKFIYYFMVLIIWVITTDILNLPMLSNLLMNLINFIPNLLVAFVMLVGGILLANWLKNLVYNIAKSLALPSASVISNLVFYFVLINILISVMLQINVNVNFLSTNLSLVIGGIVFAFALAYGLASRPVLANIISSFYLKSRYNVGDYLIIGKFEGEIIEKDNFNIVLKHKSDKIVIPISKLNEKEVIIKTK